LNASEVHFSQDGFTNRRNIRAPNKYLKLGLGQNMPPSTEISSGKRKRRRAEKLVEGRYFFVKEHRNKSGTISYRVEGTPPATSENPTPPRVRDNSLTLAEAQNHLNELELAAQNVETTEKILLHATRLNSQQLKKAELAFDELAGSDPQHIVDAVRFWNQHNSGINKTMGLRQALALCIADKVAAGRAKSTIACYQFAVGSFLEIYGESTGQLDEKGIEIKDNPIANITRHQIKKWVEGHPVRNYGLSHLRSLSSVLTWCVNNGHLKTNWAIGVPLEEISPTPKHISLLLNWQSQAFVDKGVAYKNGVAMPYVVVCLFGAIRPAEALHIEIDEVNLDKRFIRLHHTKTRLKRIVELSENATAMLKLYWKNRKGSFRIKNFRAVMGALKAAAGFRDGDCPVSERPKGWENFPMWPHDVMRHTGLSNKLTATNDVMETTRWGGNSPQVFYEHYHGLVSADQGAQFWSMLPSSMPRTPELMERIRLELVEWGLLKKDESLPAAPEVPPLSYPKRRQNLDLLRITMEELKALIWSQPLKSVARNLGCSAVFLHRYCRHKDIPTPPRGYWTRLRARQETTAITRAEAKPFSGKLSSPALKAQNEDSSCPENLAPGPGDVLVPMHSDRMTVMEETRATKSFKVRTTIPIPAAPRTQNGFIDWQQISSDDLRKWVWTHPTMQIATEWGVWENTIRKQLRKRGIVPPPPGYWAKVAAGRPALKPDFIEAA
jgi:hypothetical protein